jgi:hypothetical protein
MIDVRVTPSAYRQQNVDALDWIVARVVDIGKSQHARNSHRRPTGSKPRLYGRQTPSSDLSPCEIPASARGVTGDIHALGALLRASTYRGLCHVQARRGRRPREQRRTERHEAFASGSHTQRRLELEGAPLTYVSAPSARWYARSSCCATARGQYPRVSESARRRCTSPKWTVGGDTL